MEQWIEIATNLTVSGILAFGLGKVWKKLESKELEIVNMVIAHKTALEAKDLQIAALQEKRIADLREMIGPNN